MMKEIIVNKKYHEKKLNKVILEELSNINYPTFCKLLRKKDIKINGKRINKDILVYENDKIEIYIPKELEDIKINLDKVYEDENILVINKPANIEVTGTNSLTEIINKQYINCEFNPQPCHRIDRNTTGLVMFAKNEEALRILLEKFKKHEIEKHYLALGKDNTALLDVEIETGRTHQIRAHLAYIAHPIIGDGKYGRNEINKQFGKKYQMLCSYKLKFHFQSESGILSYLKGKEIKLENINM